MNTFQRAEALNNINIKILSGARVVLDKSWRDTTSLSPFARLYFIKDGSGFLKAADGTVFPLEKGNVYLIPAEYIMSYGCIRLEKIFFHVSVTDMEKYDLFSAYKTVHSMPFSEEEYSELERCIPCESYEQLICIKSIIARVLAKFLQKHPLQKSPEKKHSALVRSIIDYVHRNTRINLSVKNISDALFVSESTIRNTFLKETGIPIGKYIDDMVFIKAKELLFHKQMSIAEISAELGFCDQFYFSRRFKESFGETPSHFRKNAYGEGQLSL